MNCIKLFLCLLFLSFPIFSDSPEIEIVYFQPKDFLRNLFYVTINLGVPPEEIEEHIDFEHEEISFYLSIDNIPLQLVKGSLQRNPQDPTKIDFEVYGKDRINTGIHKISIFDIHSNKLITKSSFSMPDKLTGPEEQPIIFKIQPAGGIIGDSITLIGKNFGKNIENIYIQFYSDQENPNYEYREKYLSQTDPYYFSKPRDENGEQEIKFTIPHAITREEGLRGIQKFFGKKLLIKVFVSGRPSTMHNITLLSPQWKFYTGVLSILMTILFITILSITVRKLNFFPFILYDKETNMYSLSNFQAFLWTLTFIGSYFYIAVCLGLLLKNGDMPAFHPSLIALLGISYGGLISANYVDNKQIVKIKKQGEPSYKDLFCSADGSFNLSKFQLFGFTVISNIIYIFNLFQGNALEGLPEIPESLHTLLLTSQGGYVGGKYVNEVVEKKNNSSQNIPEPVQTKENSPKKRGKKES